jgi:cell division protein FtsI/penicillin-binding protein 2
MGNSYQYRRLLLLGIFLCCGLLALIVRLVDLQVFRHDELKAEAQRNTQRAFVKNPLRGQIRDVRGNLLATSVPAKVICADPTLIGDFGGDVARVLAPLLQTNEMVLAERLRPSLVSYKGKMIPRSYVPLKRKVPVETWQQIEKAMTNMIFSVDEKRLTKTEKTFLWNLRRKAIFAEEDQIRFYPNDNLAAHVIGYVANDDFQTGLNGIEATFNSKLTGIKGWRRTEMDSRRREVVAFREQDVDPRNGFNVVLTLDAGLQHIVETELAEGVAKFNPESISAVVVRPRTGEILAMATLPTYNPNRPGAFSPEFLRNRVITDIAEPGSTFKVVVVSGALDQQLVRLSDQFDCERGAFRFAGRVLHDAHGYGILNVGQIIAKSSNIGAAKVGILLGSSKLYDYIRNFGFGYRTGLPVPGEVSGIVHPVSDWSKVSIAQIPMGHGLAVTPLQMVMAFSALGNDGVLMRPMLVHRLEDEDGQVVANYQPQVLRRVISSAANREIVQALKQVTTPDGTAQKAKLDNYTVAGKTGTAQKVMPGGLRYYHDRFYSSFIAFFPAENPELCISVVIDDPKGAHFGGSTAGPVFKAIAERSAHYLNLKPDLEIPPARDPVMVTARVAAVGNRGGKQP